MEKSITIRKENNQRMYEKNVQRPIPERPEKERPKEHFIEHVDDVRKQMLAVV